MCPVQFCETKYKPLYLVALLQSLGDEKSIVFTSSVESTHRLCTLLNFFDDLPFKIKEYSRLQRHRRQFFSLFGNRYDKQKWDMWAHLIWFESDKLNSGMWVCVWVVSVFGYTHAMWECLELDCYEKKTLQSNPYFVWHSLCPEGK